MNKEEYIKSLPNAKIVLGNGFDLHCGLHTKYSDFYCKNWKKYTFIKEIIKSYINDGVEIDIDDKRVESINIWDIFFSINSSDNPKSNMYRWCDIESVLKDSLVDTRNELTMPEVLRYVINTESAINWPTVKMIYERKLPLEQDSQGFVAMFARLKTEKLKWSYGFYKFLLQQLKEFESAFGEFIYWQLHYGKIEETQFGVLNLNKLYIEKAKYVINQLCDLKNSSIDTFNFSYIHDKEMLSKMFFINGSFKTPIFGIDTVFSPDDERYIFTKTNRRMELDTVDKEYLPREDFENVIVFGHSLNQADYSYFFPLFDKLNLFDSTKNGVLVFSYFVWDESKRVDIESDLRKNVSKIIYKYAEEKGINNPKRYFDSLSIQNRVFIYELSDFDESLKNFKTRLDDEWNQLYKEIEASCEEFNN